MDGSFILESALERFLTRCQKLRSFPNFDWLSKKGDRVTEDEVVKSLVEVFVNPSYTIPLIGCFRPIIDEVVVKTVELLQLVPFLDRNTNRGVERFGADRDLSEVYNIIEFYSSAGRGLDLHEHACFAFCRALDLAPFLLGSVESYFKFAPPPFQRILNRPKPSDPSLEVAISVLFAVRISYRLLSSEFNNFAEVWDLSCFLELVSHYANLDLHRSSADIVEVITDTRWCGLQIMTLILELSEEAISNLGVGHDDAFSCLLRWKQFCWDVSLEDAATYVDLFNREELELQNGSILYRQRSCLSSSGLNSVPKSSSQYYGIEPRIKRQRNDISDVSPSLNDTSAANPFVLTSAVKKSYEMMLLAVSQKWPVLLYGPTGSGKSALISKLSQDSGNEVLSIQMDDQIDGRTLIGSYVCTEKPGEFRWQPGSLTQALLKGYWVVFEDIDNAPSDVHSVISPLLDGARFFATGHGQEIKVAENFRLFSTISTSYDGSCITEGGNAISGVWRKVMVAPSTVDDLQTIVKACYSSLESLSTKLTETFECVNSVISHQTGEIQSGNSASVSYPSRFSSRDLLKWCKRIEGTKLNFYGDKLDSDASIHIYQEAVDIFAAFSTSMNNRQTIMEMLARVWEVRSDISATLYPSYKDKLQKLLSELRVSLSNPQSTLSEKRKSFIDLRSSIILLARLASSVKWNEPVLLVGETGTGKTTLVQDLASRLDQKLTVLNLSQQSDVSDLLGGYKPMDENFVYSLLYKEFEKIFQTSFPAKDNLKYLKHLQELLSCKKWDYARKVFAKAIGSFHNSVKERRELVKKETTDSAEEARSESLKKRKRTKVRTNEEIEAWENFRLNLENARGMIFSFVEGAFITAMKNGEWILLDEVNLAPPETLQRIMGVLEGEHGSLCLAERGDICYIKRHPNFRLFACMNPATDAGKRDLPFSLRSRFTEYFVDEVLDDKDLEQFVVETFGDLKSKPEIVKNIVTFYKTAKKLSDEKLQDGANQKPQYSLRSLYRALKYAEEAERYFGFEKAIYDGFCMFFLTLLDSSSAVAMEKVILDKLLEKKPPKSVSCERYLSKRYTIGENWDELRKKYKYVRTASVEEHLRNLARAIWTKNQKYPVLLQGPTSSGKTSLVRYLATVTNHKFVRINNHEHTDLQEYLGSYIPDASGNLVFQEGALVKAVRNGDWIVLDELNLAPSDVLEALNRLLDDNRELFVPELQESIHAHPNFMLFATQNPPGLYGGRKMLSRAFRNRFVEIHVDEIPDSELSIILKGSRPQLSEKMATNMVAVMKKLQEKRQTSNVFAGKHGFITPRDLFRWADRFIKLGANPEDLVQDGYYLLAERLRDEGEKCVVKNILETQFRVKLVDLYNQDLVPDLANCAELPKSLNVSWTNSMRRLYFLVDRCYRVREPVLLVGETGAGKTTVCQLLSLILSLKVHILNCHQYSETSDFLGGFHPIRDRSRLKSDFERQIEELKISEVSKRFHLDSILSSDIGQASVLLSYLDKICKDHKDIPDSSQDRRILEEMIVKLSKMHQEWKTPFMWQDGPLVQAMRDGDLFLVDEISLADDSVLERLNSVLETERTLSLAERGGANMEEIVAHESFSLLATMNPGGDFGKRELSPALRNRFTEIWVPPVDDMAELRSIASKRFSTPELTCVLDPLLSFWKWFNDLKLGRMLTVRDLLSWVDFINVTEITLGPLCAFLHGAFLVLLDGLSLGSGISKRNVEELRGRCLSKLLEQLKSEDKHAYTMQNFGWGDLETAGSDLSSDSMQCDNIFGVHPFYIEKGSEDHDVEGFEILAPTTRRNALRVLRAMQLPKPVLLEGSPGVGKTSLVVALGKFSGHRVVRINLSEQTDMMDLLGSDLPIESDDGMKFAWSDGILLQALKEGSWVLLDELNLAPQSVLEGLNAILDHRAEVFIPELGCTFKCPSSFRIFACQNPSHQGGGRKGLPKSFLNRFTKVYVEELVDDDYLFICSSLYPSICTFLLSKLILFNKRMYEDTMMQRKFALDGSPWEFNLRDVIRSCQIIKDAPSKSKVDCFLDVVYLQRMRTESDRRKVLQLYEQVFEIKPYINLYPRVQLDSQYLYVGNTAVRRSCRQSPTFSSSSLQILPRLRQSLEAAACCVEHQWMCVVIGPASSGKTSLIRLLAQLSGNVLNELHLSSGTDISELLGCFEQYDAFRNFRSVITRVKFWVNEFCSLQLASSNEAFLSGPNDGSVSSWFSLLSTIDDGSASSFASTRVEDRERFSSILTRLEKIIKHLELVLENNNSSVSWSSKELSKVMKTILKLQEGYERDLAPGRSSAKFEWVTGVLIKAVEHGEWIVLENANCCNPSVLDRINSLVEPSGSITVNECGVIDGRPVVVRPHSNFRVFLTVNPNYGEVSRAMRNRGVEIFVMPPYWLMNENMTKCEKVELNDVKRFLVQSGIPFAKLVSSMSKSHIHAKKEGLRFNISITYLELSRWVKLFQQLLRTGGQPLWSLQTSWEHIYLSSFGEAVGGNVISHVKDTYLSVAELYESGSSQSSRLPGGWPISLKLMDLVWHSKEISVMTNCMYIEYLGAKYAAYKLQLARNRCSMYQSSPACGFAGSILMGMDMLNETSIHKARPGVTLTPTDNAKVDKALARVEKKLFYAANWTFEQTTESDLKLYLLYFKWFHSQFQPFCEFFDSLVKSITLTTEHKIWKFVSCHYRELTSLSQVDQKKHLVPMLSSGLVDVAELNDSSIKFLYNAMCCIMPLKASYHQWNSEDSYICEKASPFQEVFKYLRKLEEQYLSMFIDSSLIESTSFGALIAMYTNLLEDHISFWDSLKSSEFELSLICWHMVLKRATKLKVSCPVAVDALLKESKNLERIYSWRIHSEKSLLWVYGGHPMLPRSAKVFAKQLQIFKLCESVWPTTKKLLVTVGDPIGFVCSDMRSLVLQGISISSCMTGESDSDEDIEIYQKLLQMFEKKSIKLKEISSSKKLFSGSNLSVCCSYSAEVLGHTSGYETWRDTSPLVDSTSFALDMNLLMEISRVLLIDPKIMQQDLAKVSGHVKYALDFSLDISSRPPQMFLPHQKILWVVEMWDLVDAGHVKMASFLLEMWFRWHQSLWIYCPDSVKVLSRTDDNNIPVPEVLLQPVATATVLQILQSSTSAIKDYFTGSLKLRVASSNLWHISLPGAKLPAFLLSAARTLFQQIVYAHQKSFNADHFAEIKSVLERGNILVESLPSNSRDNEMKESMERFIEHVGTLILQSSHHGLKDSVEEFIKPLLHNLYPHCLSKEFGNGCAWLRLGILRFRLLLSCDDMDPAMKYYYKHSQIAERISLLKLEVQVRQRCDYLAGKIADRDSDEKRLETMKKLQVEQRRLQRKIIFRSDFRIFKGLKDECDKFLERVTSDVFFKLVTSDTLWEHITSSKVSSSTVEAMNLQQILDQGSNWQEMAAGFIEQLLSDKYIQYIDFVQPILVALYEMKLGLSLILTSIMQKRILNRVQLDNSYMIMGSIHSFMRFPRVATSKTISVNLTTGSSECPTFELEIPTAFTAEDISLLEKLLTFSSDIGFDKLVSGAQLRDALYRNLLVRVAHSVINARLIDCESFKLLDKIFSESANHWMSTKIQVKAKQDYASQQYKFRARAFKLESIIEVDISSLEKSFANESFTEWKSFLSEEEEVSKEQENSEDELNHMEDTSVKDIVDTHSHLFGTSNLVTTPGNCCIDDSDRVRSFSASHTLGLGMLKGLGCSFLASLDADLVPENLFRICLEHEHMFNSSHKSLRHNFYKDPNATKMYEMVKKLAPLQDRILSLLNVYEDHPQLQKIMEISDMLLNIPLRTSLAKTLSGLQFMLRCLESLEDGSKFSFKDQVEPIKDLVYEWRLLEFESWPALIDEVQDQYELNAQKLWFPLYSVLRRRASPDVATSKLSTIQSVEDFIRTSSIGEYRKRLQLLFAFLGQIKAGVCLEVYSSYFEKENEEILYNAFGYYVQFLPKILAHMESGRSLIEKKLKDLLKPCKWQDRESSLSVENSKAKRQKLRKIIREYTVMLEQPVVIFLEQDAAKGAEARSHQCQNSVIDNANKKLRMMDAAFDWTVLNDKDKCMWYTGWLKKADSALPRLQLDTSVECGHSESEDVTRTPEKWSAVWDTLQNIIRKAMDCCELWKDANKSQKKGRAFSDLLNLLKSSGLSRDVYTEDQVKSWWFIEPSFDVQHLLLTHSRFPHGFSDTALPSNLRSSSHQNLVTEWRLANAYYFTSVESVLLTHQQVGMPDPYLQQFIKIQQDQHRAANKFAEHLRHLKDCITSFEHCIELDEENSRKFSIGHNQHATFKCMWQQKQLFDSLYDMMCDEVLLLKIFESTHLSNCHSIKNEANEFLASVEKFIPQLQKSKESLNDYLLGPERIVRPSQSFVTSKQMEKLVLKNFEVIKQFRAHLLASHEQDVKSSVKDIMLCHLLEMIEKVILLDGVFNSVMDTKRDSSGADDMDDFLKTEAAYQQALRITFEHVEGAMQKLGSPSIDQVQLDKYSGKITSWETIFNVFVENMSLDQLCDKLLKTIFSAEKLVNHCGAESSSLIVRVEADFKELHLCLEILLDFGHALLEELLAIRKTVSLTTHILANLFALSSSGPAISHDDNGDDATHDVSQEQNGTGMGEGVGRNDVSDQITDEDQLNKPPEKQPSEEQDALGEEPSKNDKGVEMEEDFGGEKFSLSEDDEEDTNPNDDDEGDKLDNEEGKSGEHGALVDEKQGNKDEEENPNNSNEKYEPGSSVLDKDKSSRELRAKGDSDATDELGELGEIDNDEDERNGEAGSQDDLPDTENGDGMNPDKQADMDSKELNPDYSDEMDPPKDMELDDPQLPDEDDEDATCEDDLECPTDETSVEPEAMEDETDATSERDDGDKEDDAEMNSGLRKDVFESGLSDSISGNVPNEESAAQPKGDSKASDARDIAPESIWANSNEVNDEPTPIRGLPSNNSDMDMMTSESSNNGRNTGEQPKGQLPKKETSSVRKSQPNPYRSIGDALREWEERVRVSVDLQEGDVEAETDIENENADEFGYVTEYEKGTAQALGPATAEQNDKTANSNKTTEDGISMHKDDVVEMETEELRSDMHPNRSHDSILENKVQDQMHVPGVEKLPDEGSQHNHVDGDPESMVMDMVSVKKSYLSDDIHQLSKLSVHDDDLGKAQDPEELTYEVTSNATALWSRYERTTTRLSQELAEQLRLVMEPTMASKLEGDYKTGKRINMKKVIPYIASEYQKDKIWLRRTRPNKRDYQVVIAVDDSSSMSESSCGDVAIEALVTVCRAMAQLEMGSLAVASYGKKGNIRLLHDFDQPFTGEAGVKMISNLSFKQENTILDEPVVDLLKFLNNKLDMAAARARLPSGRNPLQQLVLIIADGRFHERERLKRCVRDAIANNRMIAFLLLDNPQDSILDLQETCFEDDKVKFTKYMESFPFPYYIVLRNIESLPRTLADLLRQWFELMQQRRD